MNKSVRIALAALVVLAALAFSAYGVAFAAPHLNLSTLLNDLGVSQPVSNNETPEATETPEVEATEGTEIEDETPEATETPEVEENDNDEDEDLCVSAAAGTTSLSSANCNDDGATIDRDDDQGDEDDNLGEDQGDGDDSEDGGSGGDE